LGVKENILILEYFLLKALYLVSDYARAFEKFSNLEVDKQRKQYNIKVSFNI